MVTKNDTQKKTLSIRISTNGFCFCSYTPTEPDSLTSMMNVYRNYTDAGDASLRLCLSYMAHGVLNLYVDWVRNPSPLPLAEVTALAVRLVEQDTVLLAGKQ